MDDIIPFSCASAWARWRASPSPVRARFLDGGAKVNRGFYLRGRTCAGAGAVCHQQTMEQVRRLRAWWIGHQPGNLTSRHRHRDSTATRPAMGLSVASNGRVAAPLAGQPVSSWRAAGTLTRRDGEHIQPPRHGANPQDLERAALPTTGYDGSTAWCSCSRWPGARARAPTNRPARPEYVVALNANTNGRSVGEISPTFAACWKACSRGLPVSGDRHGRADSARWAMMFVFALPAVPACLRDSAAWR